MKPNEQERLIAEIACTAEALGPPLSEGALVKFAGVLAEHPLDDVLAALDRTLREHSGRLTVAVVLDRLPGASRPLKADEAWSLTLREEPWNETRTCILPEACYRAWRSAEDLYDHDKVGARMAFRDAWPAAVAEYGMDVRVSEGHDREDRKRAVEAAQADGRLTAAQAVPYGVLPAPAPSDEPPAVALPAPETAKPTANGAARPVGADTAQHPGGRGFIGQFGDLLRDQAAEREASARDVDLAFAMVKIGRADDSAAALAEIRDMPEAGKAELASEIREAELSAMRAMRNAAPPPSAPRA